ncbi:MAG TPA: hypothetical protein VI893_03035, partial [Thermoplasmata archaeon]|nr:hypothetical protein [Thermoplasmata archaeon]
ILCRPRPPGQTSLGEFFMTVEGARAGEVAQGGGLSRASPLVPPPSIRERNRNSEVLYTQPEVEDHTEAAAKTGEGFDQTYVGVP